MLKNILYVVVIIIGGILLYAAVRSPEMHISREIVINASPEIIFPHINNSAKANDWMPWKEMDANLQMNYSGPAEGLGSKSSWNSEGQMGVGEALVIESIANQVVKTKLTYTKPFQMSQMAEVSLVPVASGTLVKWSVSGQNNFFFRLMGTFMNCDKMIGGSFEKGRRARD